MEENKKEVKAEVLNKENAKEQKVETSNKENVTTVVATYTINVLHNLFIKSFTSHRQPLLI